MNQINNILNKYKFIITTGCSYGIITNCVFRPFSSVENLNYQYNKNYLEMENDTIIINSSIASQGADWQADSCIYICRKLLEYGVLASNIYVIVEWSQVDRIVISPFHFSNLKKNKFDFKKHGCNVDVIDKNNQNIIGYNDIKHIIFNLLKIKKSNRAHNVSCIEEKIYINPSHTNKEYFKDMGTEYLFFLEKAKEIENSIPIESKIKMYLDNILRTQYYLNSNNINYNFFFMQGSLSGWIWEENVIKNSIQSYQKRYHPQYYDEQYKKIIINNYSPINDIDSDLENVFIEFKEKIEQIDFNKIWFYNNEKYRRGGVDEFAIDNLKEASYINISYNRFDIPINDMVCDYGRHPNFVAYILLWNKVAFNCNFAKLKDDFIEFIKNKYYEDYNLENKKTKNFITFSKKYLDKYYITI